MKWASTWDFQQCGMCDQQSLRSDQSLCESLECSMKANLLTEHHLTCLSLKGDCIGSSESTLVKMPRCWKSHVTAQNIHHLTVVTTGCLGLATSIGHKGPHVDCLISLSYAITWNILLWARTCQFVTYSHEQLEPRHVVSNNVAFWH